jgi:hypothetical protein
MPIADWLDMMPHTISYAAVVTRDNYGKPATYSAATNYRARVNYRAIRTANQFSGQDEIAAGEVWIAATFTPEQDDKITLPDGTTPPIVDWSLISDENGPHHLKILFGGTDNRQQR